MTEKTSTMDSEAVPSDPKIAAEVSDLPPLTFQITAYHFLWISVLLGMQLKSVKSLVVGDGNDPATNTKYLAIQFAFSLMLISLKFLGADRSRLRWFFEEDCTIHLFYASAVYISPFILGAISSRCIYSAIRTYLILPKPVFTYGSLVNFYVPIISIGLVVMVSPLAFSYVACPWILNHILFPSYSKLSPQDDFAHRVQIARQRVVPSVRLPSDVHAIMWRTFVLGGALGVYALFLGVY